MTLQDASFTVFDLETTGLSPRAGDRIVEIAGVRVEGGKIAQERTFLSLVNPERSISWEARRVNQISDEALQAAPTIMEVLPKFLTFAQGSTLIAHNAEFDMSFLQNEKELCWGYVEIPHCLCTLYLSRALFPREYRHNLDSVSARLQIPSLSVRHRALADVLLTAQVFLKLIEAGNIRSLEELEQKAALRTAPCR